jgi:hypothetical protein
MDIACPMGDEIFYSACEQFEILVARFIGEEVGEMEHGPFKTLILKEVTEPLQRLM